MHEAAAIVLKIFTNQGIPFIDGTTLIYACLGLVILLIKELCDEFFYGKILLFQNRFLVFRFLSYSAVILIILFFGILDGGQFIYFKF